MATTRWYLANTVTDGWQTLTTTAQTAATLTAGWVVGTGSTFSSEHNSGASSDRASTTFTANTVPDATLDTSLKDAFRSAFPLNGSFAAANWTFQFTVQGTIQTGAAGGQIVIRILKADLDGSNATQITSAQQTSASMLSIGTSDVNGALTLNPGAFTVTNQYLFIQVAWKRTVAGGMTTTNVRLRTGSAATPVGTSILSSDFTNATVLAPNIAATSVLNVPTVAIPLDVTVDASVSTAAARGARALVFPTQLVGYCFTLDSTGVFGYVKTTDGGATWGSQIAVDGAAATTVVAFDIWFDGWTPGDQGTLIHCWWFDTTNNVVRWRTLNITGDALGTVRTVFTGASAVAGRGAFVSGTKTRSGYLYCAYDLDAGAERGLHRSTDSGTTWSTNLATTFVEATLDTCKLFPASGTGDDNDCWALYYDASALALTLKLWDSSAVAQVESATIGVAHTDGPTDLTGQFGYDGAVRHTDGHLIVAALSGRDVAASQHQVFDIASTSSITTLTAIAASTDDHYYPQVFINQGTGTIFVAYNGKRDGSEALDTTTSVYYTYSQNAGVTWDVGDNVYMQDAAGPVQQVWTPCSGARFYVIWRIGTKLLGNKTNSLIQLGSQLPTIDPTSVVNEPTVVPGAVAVTNGTIPVGATATAPTVAQGSLGATIGTTLGLFAPTLAYNPRTPFWNFDGSPLTVLYALTVAGGSVTWSGVIVQKKFATAQTASVAATFDNPVAGGNTIIALTSSFSGAATTFVVTDNRASVYQVAAFAGTPNDPAVGASYAPAVAGGTTTVTAAVGTTANWQVTLHIFEVQGVLTLEGTPLIVLGTAAAMSAGNATPAGQALLFSYFSKKNALSIAPGSGWTEQGELGDGSLYLSTSNTRFVATGGSYVADAGGGVDGQPYRAMALWFTGTMTIPDKAVSGGTIAGTSQVFAPLGVFFPKPYALLAHIGATPGPDGGTTSAINSTGASLLLVHLAWYPGAGGTAEPFVSDSFGNTWIKLTKRVQTGAVASMFLYAEAPASKVGSGHTVTAAATGVYPAISFSVWEGAPPNPVVMQDGEAGQGTTTSSTAVPVEDGSLIVSGYGLAGGGGTANNGAGLAEIDEFPFNGSVNDAGGVGWLVQATAAPLTIVWTMSGSAYRTSSSVVFKPSALPPQAVTGNRIFPTRVLYAPVTVVGGVITPPGTIVQSKMATASGVNEVYVILDTPVRQGNTLIGFLFSPDTVLITNTAEIDSEYRTFNGYYRTPSTAPSVLIAYNPGAEGNQVEMYGWMFGATKITMVIVEVQGLFVPDVAGIQNSGTTAAMSAGTLTPPGAALLFGLLAKQGSSNNAPGAGWTELQDLSDGTYQISVEKQTVATGGAVAVTGSGGSDGAAYTAFGASFRDVTGSILLPYLFPTSFTRALAQVGNPLYTASTYATLHLPFDEASGVRMSTRGPQPFLEVAGPTGSAAGQFGQGANFVASNFRILSAAHDTAFQPAAGVDFTLRCWVKLNSIGATQGIVVKRNWNAPYECTFELYYYAAGNRFEWVIGNSSGTVTGTYADRPVVAGTWYLVHACYDHTLQRVVLSVNGVYWGFNNIPAGYVPNWAGSLDIGGYNIGYFDGVIDDLVLMPGFYMPYELRSFDYSNNLPFLDWNGPGGSRSVTTPDRTAWFTATTTLFAPTVSAGIAILGGLVAYYPLDESSGDAIDVFAGKTLTDTGTIGTATGKVGNARDFEASVLDFFLRMVADPAFNLPGDFTIAVWLKPETVGGEVALYLIGGAVGNWVFSTNVDGSISFARKEAGGTTKQTTAAGLLTIGAWSYVVVRYGAGAYTIWVDGVSRSLTATTTTLSTGNEFILGAGVTSSFDGLADEFAIWTAAKTDAEIAYLYNSGTGRSWANLNLGAAVPYATFHLPCDESSGNRIDTIAGKVATESGGTIGSSAGKFGLAPTFVAASPKMLTSAHSAAVQPPDAADFMVRCWIKLTTKATGQSFVAKKTGGSTNTFWLYYAPPPTDWLGMDFGTTAGVQSIYASTFGAVPTGTWLLIHAWYEQATQRYYISVNGGPPNTVSPSANFLAGSTAPLEIGDWNAGYPLDGQIDDLVILQGTFLTASQRTADYNAGAGVRFTDWGPKSIIGGTIASTALLRVPHVYPGAPAAGGWNPKPLVQFAFGGFAGANGGVTSSIDTRFCNLLVAHVAWSTSSFFDPDPVITDNQGNTWVGAGKAVETTVIRSGIWYCANPVTSALHTLSVIDSNSNGSFYPSVELTGWIGSSVGVLPLDVVTGAHASSAATLPLTSGTPAESGELIIAGCAHGDNVTIALTIDLGFTVQVEWPWYSASLGRGGAIASLVQGAAAAVAPTWNLTNATAVAGLMTSFKIGGVIGATVASTTVVFAPTQVSWTQTFTAATLASASQVFIPAVSQPGPATAIVCSTRTIRVTRRDIFRSRVLLLKRRRATTLPAAVGDQSVTATTLASGVQLFAATLAPGAVTITGATRASTLAVNAPSPVLPGPVTVTGGTVTSTLQVFAPNLTVGPVTITTGTRATTLAVTAPSLTTGPVTVVGGTITTTALVTAPTMVTVGAVTVVGGTRPTTLQMNAATVTPLTLGATIPSGSAVFAPAVAYGVTLGTRPTTFQIFVPTVAVPPVQSVTLGTIAAASVVSQPSVAPGPVTVLLGTRPTAIAVNVPAIAVGPVTVVGGTLPSTLAVSPPAVAVGPVAVVGATITPVVGVNPPSLSAHVLGAHRPSTAVLFAPSLAAGVTTGTIAATQLFPPTVLPLGALGGSTIVSTLQIFPLTVATGAVTVVGSHRPSAISCNSPSLTTLTFVTGAHRPTTGQMFSPTVTTGAVTVVGGTVGAAGALFAPTVSVGSVTILGATRPSGVVCFAPSVAVGPASALGAHCGSTLQLFPPVVIGAGALVTAPVSPTSQVFAPRVATLVVGMTISSTAQMFALTLTPRVVGATIPPSSLVFVPTVLPGLTTGFIVSTVGLFGPDVAPEVGGILLPGIGPDTRLYPPSLTEVFPPTTCLTSGVAVRCAVTGVTMSTVVAMAGVQVRYAEGGLAVRRVAIGGVQIRCAAEAGVHACCLECP